MDVTIFGIPLQIDEDYLAADPEEILEQVAEYEHGTRTAFDIEVTFPEGLTGEVMRAMVTIPRGSTRTYGSIARELDTAAQAVGQACGRNPVPLVVPCHRIVGADSLGGFSAGGDESATLKRRLLELEGARRPEPEQATLDVG